MERSRAVNDVTPGLRRLMGEFFLPGLSVFWRGVVEGRHFVASNCGVEFEGLGGWSLVVVFVGFVFAVFIGRGVVEFFKEAGEVFGGGESHEYGEVFDGEFRFVGQNGGGAAHLFLVDVIAEFASVFRLEYPG